MGRRIDSPGIAAACNNGYVSDSQDLQDFLSAERLARWQKPALVMFSDGDQVLGPHQHYLRRLIPTAMEEPLITVEDAGHFLQEDQGEVVAEHILEFIGRHPLAD